MQVRLSNKGTTLIVCFIGEIDHHSADHIRAKVDSEIIKATTRNIIFDFSKVSFMDSSGIGVVIGRYKNIQKLNGKAIILNPNIQIKKIFEMSGLFKLMPLYEDIDMALKSLIS